MSTPSSLPGWPGSPSYVVFRLEGGSVVTVDQGGALDEERAWASVSKMAVALAMCVEVDWGLHQITENFGPRGATLSNLLSHSSGLGLEQGDPVVAVASKRVYSNYGIDHAVEVVVKDADAAQWLDDRVFRGFGMNHTHLDGRPSSGVVGSTQDLARLGVGWLRSDGITISTRDRFIKPFLPDLDGIVPGFGRFSPCPWGLGPEVRGDKHHWMGDWPPSSFGHFGQSGALMLLNADEQIGVVATSTEDFGPWAVELWPRWTSEMRSLALGS
ncbi:MAG: serine hydrolase domain-containing protein [Acidimicrobiales bacterium]